MTVPVPFWQIHLSKLFIAAIMVLLTQIWIGVLFIITGKLAGLAFPIPPELPFWLFFGAIGGIVICALQLCFSLVIRSFAVPVGIAMMGGVAGLAAFAKGYGVWFPYSLLSLGMGTNDPSGGMQCSIEQFILSSIVYLIISLVFVLVWFKKRDVIAD